MNQPALPYDSRRDTVAHILLVQALLNKIADMLISRGLMHDQSKFGEHEKPLLDEYTPKLKNVTYGSMEYMEMLKGLRPALEHHYAVNSHHPEHCTLWDCPFCKRRLREEDTWVSTETTDPDGNPTRFCTLCSGGHAIYETSVTNKDRVFSLEGFDLLDLVEMLCDWKAATTRHADGDIMKSLEVNTKRFHLSPQVTAILENTIKRLGWSKKETT